MANRLARESSPYLLQHAENPVDWYAWGEEAFARARDEDRPVLLSIGYSACHWCHVMERESFEDEATAALMNAAFVNVKVDREERPDVDAVYMRAVQAMTGHGGWPMTVFLTPDPTPFYGGTCLPPEPRHGMPAFRQVLTAAADAYHVRRADVTRAAEEMRSLLQRAGARSGQAGPVDEALLERAYRALSASFDVRHGGFGQAPKFPQPGTLEFLLHHHARGGDEQALAMALQTLRSMAGGGIRDHLGGGFHRYTVDARWLVPHFEKMLYDNALLLRLYVAAWQQSGETYFRGVAVDIAEWLLADMRAPSGGFYSARDADSEGAEGTYYVWSLEEVEKVLGEQKARRFTRVYDVSAGGNWEGTNILHLPHDPAAIARAEGVEPEALERELAEARAQLLEARAQREPPFRDEKVLAGWNGLALRAFAEAGAVLDREEWVDAARAGLEFVNSQMRRDDRLLHVWKDGEAKVGGFLEDYAAVGNALLSLHEATLEPGWLVHAHWCVEKIMELFWDDADGVFYDAAVDAEALMVRPRDISDTSTPAGNSLALELLQRAARLFGDDALDAVVARTLERESAGLADYPVAFGWLLSVAARRLMPPVEVAVIGPPADPRTNALARAALRRWSPQRVVMGGEEGRSEPFPTPLLEGRGMREGRPTAYVCSGYACREPVGDAAAVESLLAEVAAG